MRFVPIFFSLSLFLLFYTHTRRSLYIEEPLKANFEIFILLLLSVLTASSHLFFFSRWEIKTCVLFMNLINEISFIIRITNFFDEFYFQAWQKIQIFMLSIFFFFAFIDTSKASEFVINFLTTQLKLKSLPYLDELKLSKKWDEIPSIVTLLKFKLNVSYSKRVKGYIKCILCV